MDFLVYLLVLLLIGLVVGALARLALPGPDPLSIAATIGLGLAGTLIAGLVMRLLFDDESGAGIVVSVLVSTLLLWALRRTRGGHVTPYNTKR
jgi:uncharacterized membrane protein YeaQ/YmgE (transglycosylase-associated protein family)